MFALSGTDATEKILIEAPGSDIAANTARSSFPRGQLGKRLVNPIATKIMIAIVPRVSAFAKRLPVRLSEDGQFEEKPANLRNSAQGIGWRRASLGAFAP
jgi:hypothetical protein